MAVPEVKALTFDVFGTVVNWRDSIAREAKAFLGPKGYDRDWHVFADNWRARYQPAMAKVRNGERPWAKLDDLHRENLVELLRETEVSGLSDGDIDYLNRAWHRLDGWPDIVEGLTRLKRKIHPGDLVEWECRDDGEHGQARRVAVGRDPRCGSRPCLQAATRGLRPDRRLSRPEAGAMHDGSGAQRRPARRPRSRLPYRVRQPAARARSQQDQGCAGRARFRCDRRQLY